MLRLPTFVIMSLSKLPSFSIQKEPLFIKALEINGIVRNIVKSLATSKTIFELRDSTIATERCLDALQLSAIQLSSSVAQASVTADYHKRIYFRKHILRLTEDLEVYCNVIERHKRKTKGLKKLNKAIKDFGSLRHCWEINITQQN